jgi:hypothetical protein
VGLKVWVKPEINLDKRTSRRVERMWGDSISEVGGFGLSGVLHEDKLPSVSGMAVFDGSDLIHQDTWDVKSIAEQNETTSSYSVGSSSLLHM